MQRLTKRTKDGVAYWLGVNGVSYSDNQGNIYGNAITKLAEYEDLEEQGLMIKLPCKVGDKYYRVVRTCSMDGREEKGDFFPTKSDCDLWCNCNHKSPCDKEYMILEDTFQSLIGVIHRAKDIGVSYFLTEKEAKEKRKELEEAEAKLKEMEVGDE